MLMDMYEKGMSEALEKNFRSPSGRIYAAKASAEVLDLILGLGKHEFQQEEAAVRLMRAIAGDTGDGRRVTVNIVLPDDPTEPPSGEGSTGT